MQFDFSSLSVGCGGGIISILLGLTYNVPLYLIEKQESTKPSISENE